VDVVKDAAPLLELPVDRLSFGMGLVPYSPASQMFPLLFDLTTPLEDLGKELLHRFGGETLTMEQVYIEHSVGRPFVAKNYKRILNELEEVGKVPRESLDISVNASTTTQLGQERRTDPDRNLSTFHCRNGCGRWFGLNETITKNIGGQQHPHGSRLPLSGPGSGRREQFWCSDWL